MVNNPDDLDYRFSLDFERRLSRVESVSMMFVYDTRYNSNDRLIMTEKEELLFRCFGGSSPDCRLLFFLCRNNFRERNTGCSQHSGGGTIVLKETHKEALSAGTAPFHLGLSFARHLSVSNVLITAV